MKSNQVAFITPQFALLSDSQKEQIHLAGLEVLRRTGVRVYSEEAIELLRKAGCPVSDGNLIKIPSHLVEQCLRSAPQSIAVYDRHGQPAMSLEGTNVYYGTGSDLPTVIDPFTGDRRRSEKRDIANAAKLCDALEHISFNMSMALPSDVPVATSDIHSFEAMVVNSTKPVTYTAHDREGLSTIIRIASTIAGDTAELQQKPFLILYTEPSSPLQHSQEAVEKLMVAAENNLPVVHAPGMVLGAAAPVTIGGGMVLGNAELLSGLVISQLARPGAPCIYGSAGEPLDMRTMVLSYAAPEHLLMVSAMVEMGRYYKLPTWGFSGCSDSKIFDEQAGIEGALWTLMSALSGANLVHDVGYLESGLTCSLEMIAACNEVIGLCERVMGGIEMDEETLAVDAIHEVGPGGHFLASPHTKKHFKENWYPSLLDRRNYDEWAALGSTSLGQRVQENVRDILANHTPQPLPARVRSQIDSIIEEAEQRR